MSIAKPKQDGAGGGSRRREWVKLMNLSVVGMVFPVSLLIGYFGGRWVGSWFEATRSGGLVGSLLGLAAGFYNVFKMVGDLGSSANETPPANPDADASDDHDHGL